MKVYEVIYFDPQTHNRPTNAGLFISEGLANRYVNNLLDEFPDIVFKVKEVTVYEDEYDFN